MANKQNIMNEIAAAFSLSGETAAAACLLLEARAQTLDYTFDEYLECYHPEGVASKDENLPEGWKGYVRFLGDDAAAVLRAGKGANFSTFVHECAHVFRRQLTGELREQAEKAFGIEGEKWSEEKEELFARGLERWIKQRYKRDRTRGDIYNKGKNFVDTVYRGMEHIVEIDPRMEAVYERLFEDNPYRFLQSEYENAIHHVAEGKLPEHSHVFLGMTPRVYEQLGFERLPMAITGKHLYTTLRENGEVSGNYHDLGEDVLKQLPEQLKKPLLIVQSPNDDAEIISIFGLKDKNGDTIIVPVAQYQQGNLNGVNIDINLVKSIYGKTEFEAWIKTAINDDRLLYIDQKKTELALTGKLPHSAQDHSIPPPEFIRPALLQDVSGFVNENIARYKESVKHKYPERFSPAGTKILYQRDINYSGQLAFDFKPPEKERQPLTNTTTEKPANAKPRYSPEDLDADWHTGVFTVEDAANSLGDGDTFQGYPASAWKTFAVLEAEYRAGKISAQELDEKRSELFSEKAKEPETIQNENIEASAIASVKPSDKKPVTEIPLSNTPENFLQNFTRIADNFKDDKIEAARYLLRHMERDERETTLAGMREAGCASAEDFHRYLHTALDGQTPDKEQELFTLGLQALGNEIARQRTERNSKLTAITKQVVEQVEKLESVDTLYGWLESSEGELRIAKDARLTEIQRQYNFDGGVEISGNILYSHEIPDRVSPADIKEMMVFNAHTIVTAIKQRINQLTPSLFPRRQETAAGPVTVEYAPYGAWTDFGKRLAPSERERYNSAALTIIEKSKTEAISEDDKSVLRRYSGFGGIAAEGERGVLYDYYTSPPAARLTWRLLEKAGGVTSGGAVLEPSCGTGVFITYAPPDQNLAFTGVELDGRTAGVAKILHDNDKTEILNQSFEAFNLSEQRGGFDHVIGNAPFGERSTALRALDERDEKSLDNYFTRRSIDNLKAGGTMALIAAPGVLENAANEAFRLAVNTQAQFIGAVKLPDKSFHHTHTQVTPDILLFRKYPDDIAQRLSALDTETFKTTPLYNEDFVSGKYFWRHREHIAGTVSEHTGQWGKDEIKGDITPESIESIINNFIPAEPVPEHIFERIRKAYALPDAGRTFEALRLNGEELNNLRAKTLWQGAIKIHEQRVYLLSDTHDWRLTSTDAKLAEKIEKTCAVSKTVRAIQGLMQNESPLEAIREQQALCWEALANYAAAYGTPPGDDKDIKKFIREYPAVQGLYEASLPADDPLLTSENVYRKEVDILDGHNAAVTALLTLREKMRDGTEENIKELFPAAAETLMSEMRGHNDIFITPEGSFQLREDFIAEDAWEKIETLKAAAAHEPEAWKQQKLVFGADELERAVGWTPIEDAGFSPRSSWIPQDIVRDWASNTEALGQSQLQHLAKNDAGKWGVNHRGEWTEENDPLIYYLNGQKQRSKYNDTETYNKEHDELFRSFIASHETYREQLESEYNRKFKTHIIAPVKTYPVEITGWRQAGADGTGKTLKPHQWQSIHHLYRRQRGISALGTGFGKTVTAAGLMSLLRQEGKAKRFFLQVPNNKVKDWITEIKDVMPGMKIAVIDPEEAGYASRDKRYAKYQAMARSCADIIIMPESSASEIQLNPANDEKISGAIASRYRLEKDGGTARQQEKAAMKGERKAASGKTNVTICFEDFGCDALIVDEAHRYKNLFSSTLSRETGLNDGRQSAKAMSLYKKSEYIREQNNGKNVFLLTATPLTNSPLEYYNMTQYIAPEELRKMGVSTIDGFIHEFANIETGWLYDWGNGQAKQGRILTGFKNLPTLQNLFFMYTDLQTNSEAADIEKPLAENIPHVIGADTKQTNVIKAISKQLDGYKSLDAEQRKDQYPGENFLTFYSRMRTASLDLELYDPHKYKNWKNPKLDALARDAYARYKETKGGQVIFCDRVFSSDASFNMHEKIKKELAAQGFKEKEIVIVNGFTKGGGSKSDSAVEKEVSKAIADYNAGKYKVIIGSTACIGEGVNLQKNSSAAHHFDIPFRPSDFIQRNGRVDRQGNAQEKVSLHTYLASGTIDNYSVNLVQRKANWIDQLLRTKSDVFTNPNDENSIDADELLLSLTEEWGDKDAALKRRETLEQQKAAKILEAQTGQMSGQLKNLSLARGAFQPLEGKEHTKEYQKRITHMTSLESALRHNPVFKRHDLLGNREPFLYNASNNKIYRKGDVLVTRGGTYLVEKLNLKKQELACTRLLSEEEQKERVYQARHYGTSAVNEKRNFKLPELQNDGKAYAYNTALYHFEKASTETREAVRVAPSESFYTLPAAVKEQHYAMHLAVAKERSAGCNPFTFALGKDGILTIERARNRSDGNGEALNPCSPEGRDIITRSLEKGVKYSEYDKDNIIETVATTIPELAKPVRTAIAKNEEQEQTTRLKEELVKQAAAKMNADKTHIKSRVHVVR